MRRWTCWTARRLWTWAALWESAAALWLASPAQAPPVQASAGQAVPLQAVWTQVAETRWLPGPGASGPSTVVGAVDTPAAAERLTARSPVTVSGWAVDRTARGWAGVDAVEVYVGVMGDGGELAARGTVAMDRPDVAERLADPYWAASGFGVRLERGLELGTNDLRVYVHTPDRGWWYRPLTLEGVRVSPTPERLAPSGLAAVQYLLVGQLGLGPLLGTLVPRLRRGYLAAWPWLLPLQAIVAGGALAAGWAGPAGG